MQFYHPVCLSRQRQFCPGLLRRRFCGQHLLIRFGALDEAAGHHVDQALVARGGILGGPFQPPPIPARVFAEPAPLGRIGAHKFLQVIGPLQLRLQPFENGCLDLVEPVACLVAAAAAFGGRGAADADCRACAVMDRHAPAADGAADDSRKWPGGRPGGLLAGSGGGLRESPGLGCREQIGGHDAQMFGGDFVMRFGRVVAVHATAGIGIAHHGHAIPHQAAVIHRVAQDAVSALLVAVDRVCSPFRPARRHDAFGIQRPGNGAGALTCDIIPEDAADDVCLVFDDLAHARLARHRAIAIAEPAGMPPFTDHAREAAARLGPERVQEHGAHQAAQADRDCIGHTIMHGLDFDPREAHALVDMGQILLIAAEPVQRLDQDHVKGPRPCLFHQPGKAITPEDAGRGLGAIGKGGDDRQAAPRGVIAAERNLIVNRSLVLEL